MDIAQVLISFAYIITGYLAGMAFAGSFLDRKCMRIMDIILHRLLDTK